MVALALFAGVLMIGFGGAKVAHAADVVTITSYTPSYTVTQGNTLNVTYSYNSTYTPGPNGPSHCWLEVPDGNPTPLVHATNSVNGNYTETITTTAFNTAGTVNIGLYCIATSATSEVSVPITVTVNPGSAGALSLTPVCIGGVPKMSLSWNPAQNSSGNYGPYTIWRDGSVVASNVSGTTYTDPASGSLSFGTSYNYTVAPSPNIFYNYQAGTASTLASCPASPATITVTQTPVSGGTWNITPGNYTSTSNTVNPASGGTTYTLTSNSVPSGYTLGSITNSVTGSSASFVGMPGGSYNYTINYTPIASGPSVDMLANGLLPGKGGTISLAYGQSLDLSWTSTNATLCTTGAPMNSGVNVNGSSGTMAYGHPHYPVAPSTTYSITCTNGVPSDTDTVTVQVPPNPPTGFSASASVSCGNNAVTLTWSASVGASSYKVYRSITSGSGYGLIASNIAGTSYTDSTGTSNTTYYYVVQAVDAAGSSGNSAEDSVTTPAACPPVPVVTITANPTSGTVNAVNPALTWSATNAPTSCTASGDWSGAKSVTGTNVFQGTLTQIKTYTYTLVCTNAGGSSAPASANVVVSAAGNSSPTANAGPDKAITLPTTSSAPTGTSATDSDGSISSTVWSFVSGPVTPTITNGSTLTPTFTNMTVAGTYVFRLTATDNLGATGSDTMQVTVSAAPVPVVTITANPTSGTVNVVNPSLTWTVTNSPTSCTASGDWSGAKATSGTNVSQGVLTQVKTYTFTLTCANGSGSGTPASATVVVSAATTASITVNQTGQTTGTWSINGGVLTGTGATAIRTVTPAACAGGTNYTITPATISGYTYAVTPASTLNVCPGGSITFNVAYSASFDYSVSNGGPVTLTAGGSSGQTTVTKTLVSGTSQSINDTVSGVPANVNVSYTANRDCLPTCTDTVTFTALSSAVAGTYPITITTSGGGIGNKTSSFNLVINPAATVTLVSNPSGNAVVGQTVTWTANPSGCTSYTWSGTDIPGGSTGGNNTYSFTYQSTGAKTVNVTAVCSSVSIPASGNILIGVNPKIIEF